MGRCWRATGKTLMAREIRFAAGSRDDLRSSVWRLWANKNDLFLAARSLAGQSKMSFHESGVCRHAVVSQTPRAPIDRWTRPLRSREGITPAIDVIVPAFSVPDGYRDIPPPPNKVLELLPPPSKGTKRIIRIFLTDPDFGEADVLAIPHISSLSFHGRVQLLREQAWIISYVDELKPEEVSFLDRMVNTTRINLIPGSSVGSIERAQMHIYEKPRGRTYPQIVDVQLGPGNVYVETDA